MRTELVFLWVSACVAAESPRITSTIEVWPPLMYAQPPGLKEILLKNTAPGTVVLRDGRDAQEVAASPLGSALLVGPLTVSPNHAYELLLDGVYFGTLRIGQDNGAPPQWLGEEAFVFSDDLLVLQRRVNRSCRLLGAPQEVVVEPYQAEVRTLLQPDTEYALTLVCRDPTGRETPPWTIAFRTLPEQRLLLNEVVVDPQRDWNDSGAKIDAGVPFDDITDPAAKPSATDEWVELVNAGTAPVDASAWRLRVNDRDQTEVWIGETQTFGELVVPPGSFLVARLSPSGKNATNTAKVRLIDPIGAVRDRVELSVTVPDGTATSQANEAIARCGAVWLKQRATPGRSNGC